MPFIPTNRPDHSVEGLICQFGTSGIKFIAKIVALYHNLPYANCDLVPNITSSEAAYGEIEKEKSFRKPVTKSWAFHIKSLDTVQGNAAESSKYNCPAFLSINNSKRKARKFGVLVQVTDFACIV